MRARGQQPRPDVIAEHFPELPAWLGVLVTTRPETPILKKLANLEPRELKADDASNRDDVRAFLEAGVRGRVVKGAIVDEQKADECRVVEADVQAALATLDERANGIFLYARYAVLQLERSVKEQKGNKKGRPLTRAEVEAFPADIGGFYGEQLTRLLGREGDDEKATPRGWSPSGACCGAAAARGHGARAGARRRDRGAARNRGEGGGRGETRWRGSPTCRRCATGGCTRTTRRFDRPARSPSERPAQGAPQAMERPRRTRWLGARARRSGGSARGR